MKRRYTVVWSPAAEDRLAALWLDNLAVRGEITDAVNEVDSSLAHAPEAVGVPVGPGSPLRYVVRPPITILFRIHEADQQVRIHAIKFWDE